MTPAHIRFLFTILKDRTSSRPIIGNITSPLFGRANQPSSSPLPLPLRRRAAHHSLLLFVTSRPVGRCRFGNCCGSWFTSVNSERTLLVCEEPKRLPNSLHLASSRSDFASAGIAK